jgi:hypothetical protein
VKASFVFVCVLAPAALLLCLIALRSRFASLSQLAWATGDAKLAMRPRLYEWAIHFTSALLFYGGLIMLLEPMLPGSEWLKGGLCGVAASVIALVVARPPDTPGMPDQFIDLRALRISMIALVIAGALLTELFAERGIRT